MKDCFDRKLEIGEIIFIKYINAFALIVGQKDLNPIVVYFDNENKLQKHEVTIRDSQRSCIKLLVPLSLSIAVYIRNEMLDV